MDSRPATQASKGRQPASLGHRRGGRVGPDKARRSVHRSVGTAQPKPIWVGLGAVVALSAAVIIGTMLRTGTPGGDTSSATSAPADSDHALRAGTGSAPIDRAHRRADKRSGHSHRHRNPGQHLGQGRAVRERRQLGHQHRQRLPRWTAVHYIDLAFLRRLGYAAPGQPYRADRCRRTRARRPGLEGLAGLLPQARPALILPLAAPPGRRPGDAEQPAAPTPTSKP